MVRNYEQQERLSGGASQPYSGGVLRRVIFRGYQGNFGSNYRGKNVSTRMGNVEAARGNCSDGQVRQELLNATGQARLRPRAQTRSINPASNAARRGSSEITIDS